MMDWVERVNVAVWDVCLFVANNTELLGLVMDLCIHLILGAWKQ